MTSTAPVQSWTTARDCERLLGEWSTTGQAAAATEADLRVAVGTMMFDGIRGGLRDEQAVQVAVSEADVLARVTRTAEESARFAVAEARVELIRARS